MLGISTWLLVGGQANFARIDRSNYSCKHTWPSTRHEDTAFFRRLLHYRVCTRDGCASLSSTASQKLISSTRHMNGQLWWYGHAYQLSICANIKWWMRVRAYSPYCGMVSKQKHSCLKTIMQQNWRYFLIDRYCICTCISNHVYVANYTQCCEPTLTIKLYPLPHTNSTAVYQIKNKI